MTNKIIFLDVDGVINTIKHSFCKFDEECVERIRVIINATNAKIVISSSWREGDLTLTKKHFPDWMHEHIVGETRRGRALLSSPFHLCRGNEIQDWLESNFKEKKLNTDYTYVILDDDMDMLLCQGLNFIKTDIYYGIQDKHVEQAINILNVI